MEDDETLIVGELVEGSGEFKRQISKAGQQGGTVRGVSHLPLVLKGNMPVGFRVHDLNSPVFWKMLM